MCVVVQVLGVFKKCAGVDGLCTYMAISKYYKDLYFYSIPEVPARHTDNYSD